MGTIHIFTGEIREEKLLAVLLIFLQFVIIINEYFDALNSSSHSFSNKPHIHKHSIILNRLKLPVDKQVNSNHYYNTQKR